MNEIKRVRDRLRLTRAEMGDQMGVDERTVARWETGDRQPTVAKAWQLIHLARASRVSTDLARIYPDPYSPEAEV